MESIWIQLRLCIYSFLSTSDSVTRNLCFLGHYWSYKNIPRRHVISGLQHCDDSGLLLLLLINVHLIQDVEEA